MALRDVISAAFDASMSKMTDAPRALLALRSTSRSGVMFRRCGSSACHRNGPGPARMSSALVYVSLTTRRRSILSSRTGCSKRCSRMLRNVSTNRRRSARRAEARANNSCRASSTSVVCGSTMQGVSARRQTSAARLLVVCVRRTRDMQNEPGTRRGPFRRLAEAAPWPVRDRR